MDISHSPLLQQRTHRMNATELSKHILLHLNTSNAYVMRESAAQFVLTLVNFAASDDGPIFRVMRETLECGLVAYALPPRSPFRVAVNLVIQASREAGLYRMYEVWTMRYLRSIYPPLPLPDRKRSRPVALAGFVGVFYVYGLGVAVAVVAFAGEVTVKWAVTRRRHQHAM